LGIPFSNDYFHTFRPHHCEGFELSVSSPQVIRKLGEDGITWMEPSEEVFIEVPETLSGLVIEKMQTRQASMLNMELVAGERVKLEFHCPSRGLIGLRSELMRESRGEAIMNHIVHEYVPAMKHVKSTRKGCIIAMDQGITTTHALEPLEARGTLFVGPREDVYDGMIVGESSKEEDLEVNPTKAKQLNNFRAAGKEDFVQLSPPRTLLLEECIGYIQDDELIEVTPSCIRLRKKHLSKDARRKHARSKKDLLNPDRKK
jgi:GTP-binding protein